MLIIIIIVRFRLFGIPPSLKSFSPLSFQNSPHHPSLIRETMLTIACKFSEVESIAGAPGVLPTPFAAMHGLPSPLAGPYNGVPPAGGLAGLGGFPLGAAGLGVRVPTNAQTSAVLLVSNLNEEVSDFEWRSMELLCDVVEDMEIQKMEARRKISIFFSFFFLL